MAWVSADLVEPTVAGTTVSSSDVISKEFSAEDPRYLVAEVVGTLASYKLQGRNGNGPWRDLKTALTNGRLVFVGPDESTAELLDDRLRIVATGGGTVNNVYVIRGY